MPRHRRRWRRGLVVVLVVSAGLYTGASAAIVSLALQTRDFCPAGSPVTAEAETVTLRSPVDDIELASWLIPGPTTRAVILLHGIDSNAWAAPQGDLALAYADAGFHVLLLDLRAHARSGGERLTLGDRERADVRAGVELLLDRGARAGAIGLHGTSYGAAMALLAAAEIPEVGAVVADSPFADVRDVMAAQVERRLGVPAAIAGTVLRPGIETAARVFFGLDLPHLAPARAVAELVQPLLLIHGEDDRTIPAEHSRRLEQVARGPVELWVLPETGHVDGVRAGRCHQDPAPTRDRFLSRVVGFMAAAL